MKLNLLTASWLLGPSAKKPNYYNQSFAGITENQLAGPNYTGGGRGREEIKAREFRWSHEIEWKHYW